jgi:hypothetical protein
MHSSRFCDHVFVTDISQMFNESIVNGLADVMFVLIFGAHCSHCSKYRQACSLWWHVHSIIGVSVREKSRGNKVRRSRWSNRAAPASVSANLLFSPSLPSGIVEALRLVGSAYQWGHILQNRLELLPYISVHSTSFSTFGKERIPKHKSCWTWVVSRTVSYWRETKLCGFSPQVNHTGLSGRRLSEKLVPTSAQRFPTAVNLWFLDPEPLLISRGWVDPVPDIQLLREDCLSTRFSGYVE